MPYFTREKSSTGEWIPVVYYERPPKSVNGSDPERLTLHPIDEKYLGYDGVSPEFALLEKDYPL